MATPVDMADLNTEGSSTPGRRWSSGSFAQLADAGAAPAAAPPLSQQHCDAWSGCLL